MAQNRTPTNILDLKGAFKKNPDRGRARENEPEVEAFDATPPKHLSVQAKETWKEIVELVPDGVLGKGDRLVVEMLANLLADYRAAPSDFPANRLTRLSVDLGRLGMTPADRSKVAVPKKDEESPFK